MTAKPERGRWWSTLLSFAAVGVGSTALYFIVYNLARTALPASAANAAGWLVCLPANFYLNRRFTFTAAGTSWLRPFVQFCLVYASTAVACTGMFELYLLVDSSRTRLRENLALLASQGALVLLRFVLVRQVVFSNQVPSETQSDGISHS